MSVLLRLVEPRSETYSSSAISIGLTNRSDCLDSRLRFSDLFLTVLEVSAPVGFGNSCIVADNWFR